MQIDYMKVGDYMKKYWKSHKWFRRGVYGVLWAVLLYICISGLFGLFVIKPIIHQARTADYSQCYQDSPENYGFIEGQTYERVNFESLDGLILTGLYFPVENAQQVVIATHGFPDPEVGGCAEFMLPLVPRLTDVGYSVFLPTLSRFGESEGDELSGLGRTEWQNVAGAAKWIEEHNPNVKITLLGLSGGGGATLKAVSRGYGDYVIVLNPYTVDADAITWRIKQQYGIPQSLMDIAAISAVKFEYSDEAFSEQPMEWVAKYGISQPTLIVGGKHDQILPPYMLETLEDEIGNNAGLAWIDDGGHDLIRKDTAVLNETIDEILLFLDGQQ